MFVGKPDFLLDAVQQLLLFVVICHRLAAFVRIVGCPSMKRAANPSEAGCCRPPAGAENRILSRRQGVFGAPGISGLRPWHAGRSRRSWYPLSARLLQQEREMPDAGTSMQPTECRPTVLLVDDHEESAHAWSTVLRMNGWEVVWAPDGNAALALARLARPDLLITDWNMPGRDGPGLCRAFREDLALASVPIILASSLQFPHGAAVLHDHFLQKPVQPSTLLAAMSGLLDGFAIWPAPADTPAAG
ncbi:UNVERIFIED_ORG: CheY-like chemotaxis protein [Burkholderia sp. 1595]|uniref:CheY-like chemotaxis protein n=1 Tax=Paraburkholderia terricola TaxID=169427 RepID=A0ABU1M029_9BURK|nr:response regulator [Paraburkholderia terricola]MDR6412211.1 CheY-like chemotaxis protein [Paraburkholderia terricola]